MGKKFGRFFLKLKRIFNYFHTVLSKLIKTLIQSVMMCVPVVLIFILINTFLGVHIGFGFYSKLTGYLILAVLAILCILRYDAIFIKHAKASKNKTVPTNTRKKTQRTVQRKRKRIS